MKSLMLIMCLGPLISIADNKPLTLGPSPAPADKAGVARPIDAQSSTTNAQPTTSTPQQISPGTNAAPFLSGRNMDSLDEKKKLAIGDTITFRVVEDQEAPKLLVVTDAGELDVPELGLLTANGKTCKQLALEIKSRLEETTYYRATVIVGIQLLNKTISGRRVYVAGQVRRTGSQEIPAGEIWTVSKAILNAGGFTDYADKKKVRLVRSGANGTPGKTLVLNVDDIWRAGRTELDLPVETEDLIYVPARAFNFY